MFDEDQLKLLLEFYNHCYNTTPENEEASAGWCQSYYTYEVLQGLILGDERYEEKPWPSWLADREKYRTHGPVRKHIAGKRSTFKLLKEIGHLSDNLLICEIGYGMDLVIAMMVKEWNKVLSYDHNPYMEKGLVEFFVERHGVNLEFKCSPSNYYRFDEINEPTIVLSNYCHVSVDVQAENIKNNDNLIYVRDGEVIDKELIPLDVAEFRKVFGRGYL